jgi:hypothetical protein
MIRMDTGSSDDRAWRRPVREEHLRVTAALRGSFNLSSWRARSGQRYVVGVHPLSEPDLLDISEAVIIAVRRDRDGVASLVDVVAAGDESVEGERRHWLSAVREGGATEMHIHRLAEDAEERHAIVAELRNENVRPLTRELEPTAPG